MPLPLPDAWPRYEVSTEADLVSLERLGVEVPANPFEHFLVLGMTRIGDGSHELLVSPHTAAALRRTRSLSSDTRRVVHPAVSRKDLLDDHIVLPVIAEVVDVADRRARLCDFAQAGCGVRP